jgi:hypothetical protein
MELGLIGVVGVANTFDGAEEAGLKLLGQSAGSDIYSASRRIGAAFAGSCE